MKRLADIVNGSVSLKPDNDGVFSDLLKILLKYEKCHSKWNKPVIPKTTPVPTCQLRRGFIKGIFHLKFIWSAMNIPAKAVKRNVIASTEFQNFLWTACE